MAVENRRFKTTNNVSYVQCTAVIYCVLNFFKKTLFLIFAPLNNTVKRTHYVLKFAL